MPVTKKRSVLYAHVDPNLKKWFKALCNKQAGRVSQSTMLTRILIAAKKNPDLIKAA